MDPRGHHDFWVELQETLSTHSTGDGRPPIEGRRVMDIGPAEGLFTLLALSAGAARVEIVHPDNVLLRRFKRVMTLSGNHDRVGVNVGLFPKVGANVVAQCDVILVLGVVYHAMDCEAFVEPLLAAKKPICWEFMYALTEPREFDPRVHDDSRSGLFSRRWLENRVTMAGHEIRQCDRYNARCGEPGYLSPHAVAGGWSRAAFVSLPLRA